MCVVNNMEEYHVHKVFVTKCWNVSVTLVDPSKFYCNYGPGVGTSRSKVTRS